jgi:hypothetical protein
MHPIALTTQESAKDVSHKADDGVGDKSPTPAVSLPAMEQVVNAMTNPNRTVLMSPEDFWPDLLSELQILNSITEIFPVKPYVMAHPYGSVDAGPRLYVGYNPYHPLGSESYFKFDPKITPDWDGNLYMTWDGDFLTSTEEDFMEHGMEGSKVKDEVSAQTEGMIKPARR